MGPRARGRILPPGRQGEGGPTAGLPPHGEEGADGTALVVVLCQLGLRPKQG